MSKIGTGHEFVIVARKLGAAPLYFTRKRVWSAAPVDARLFAPASKAYAAMRTATAGDDWRIGVEGIYCLAFGHGL